VARELHHFVVDQVLHRRLAETKISANRVPDERKYNKTKIKKAQNLQI
jgi:hypothetical protein